MHSTARKLAAATAIIAAVALTGCMRADSRVTLGSDGSGTVTFNLELSEAITKEVIPSGNVTEARELITAELDDGLVGDSAPKFTMNDGKLNIAVERSFSTTRELRALLTDTSTGYAMFDTFELTQRSDRFVLNAEPSGDLSGGGPMSFSVDLDTGEVVESNMTGAPGVEVHFTIEFPAEITATNGERLDERTVTWELSDGQGEIYATAAVSGGGMGWAWLILVGAAIAGGVAALLYVAYTRRDVDEPAVEPSGRVGATLTAPVAHTPTPTPTQPDITQPVQPPTGASQPVVVAQPPPLPAPAELEPGWKPDPLKAATWRWWDGTTWTNHTN